jgi:hypothetical protein
VEARDSAWEGHERHEVDCLVLAGRVAVDDVERPDGQRAEPVEALEEERSGSQPACCCSLIEEPHATRLLCLNLHSTELVVHPCWLVELTVGERLAASVPGSAHRHPTPGRSARWRAWPGCAHSGGRALPLADMHLMHRPFDYCTTRTVAR